MHDPTPPRSVGGAAFYDSVLVLADGLATKTTLGGRQKVTEVVARVGPDVSRISFPGRIRLR